jgi:serine/threonine-protein kinase
LLERLDRSGPGELFRARDTHLGRTVAIRLLPEEVAAGTASSDALIAQARALVPLSHPNITTLFDAGEHGGRVYFAFEFVKGQSLRAEMAGRSMNPRRALELAIHVTDAVAEAHASGFMHGGLSPDSIMVTAKGHAKIPTFHLASQTGFVVAGHEEALLDYESPEEARGEAADERSDVYSIGAVLYEMLTTRRPPSRGASAPSAWNPRVLPELDEVLLRSLAPNPLSRYQGVAILASELRGAAAAVEERGTDEDDEERESGTSSRLNAIVAAFIVLMLIAAAVAGWLTTMS